MSASFKLTGGEAMRAKLASEAERIRRQMEEGMRAEMEKVAERAREEVPVRTGALRDSIRVESSVEGNQIEAAVVAGSEDAPYAVVVHEDLEAKHETGGAKFVARPLMASVPEILPGIAAKIEK
jgi:hypothetical protein